MQYSWCDLVASTISSSSAFAPLFMYTALLLDDLLMNLVIHALLLIPSPIEHG
jgi:hypothetical protein